MAAAGVDASNTEAGTLVLLPEDPDGSARAIRSGLRVRCSVDVGVLVTDTFGRSWRLGIVNVAIGAAGIEVLRDHRGVLDPVGYELHSTVIAIADEIAAAAELVMGKTGRVPVAIVRGLNVAGDGRAAELVMPAEQDLFR